MSSAKCLLLRSIILTPSERWEKVGDVFGGKGKKTGPKDKRFLQKKKENHKLRQVPKGKKKKNKGSKINPTEGEDIT